MLKNFYEPVEQFWYYAGQEYDLPEDVAKEFTGSQIAHAVWEPILNKSLGSVKGRKNAKASSKVSDSSSRRTRKSQRG
jgi:hypothetical protein